MITATEPSLGHDRQGGIWEYVSPSRLGLFLKCPLAFKLRYVDGIRSPTSSALFVGKAVHAGLEHFYRHRMLGIALPTEALVKHVMDFWDQTAQEERVTFTSTSQEAALQTQAGDLVKAYVARLPADEPRPLAVEITMQAPVVDPQTGEDLGISLLGVADLILDDPMGPLICDHKTASKAAPPFEITHELQLSCYAYLFRHLSGQRESGLQVRSIIKTKQPKVNWLTYRPRSERHMWRLFAVLREYLDALDSGRFNYRPGWMCSMCEFREKQCRTWCG